MVGSVQNNSNARCYIQPTEMFINVLFISNQCMICDLLCICAPTPGSAGGYGEDSKCGTSYKQAWPV
jgi:hypothetical protein